MRVGLIESAEYPGAFVHPTAIVAAAEVGQGTRVWAFCNLAPGSKVGRECQICDRVFVEGGAVVGDRVTVKCGVSIWDGITLETGVFVGPGAMFTNDPNPRSLRHLAEYPRTVVGRFASLGAGSILLPGLRIGAYAMIGAGAVVTRHVPEFGLAIGNPARVVGWVCVCGERLLERDDSLSCRAACGRVYSSDEGKPVLVEGSDEP